jgi:signal transduction histidine kinase
LGNQRSRPCRPGRTWCYDLSHPMAGHEHEGDSRWRVIRVFTVQGTVGLLLIIAATIILRHDTHRILEVLGSSGPFLILLFLLFAAALGSLKFELTDLVFASLLITAYMSMFPLLGVVLSSWIAVGTAIGVRILGMKQIGPVKLAMEDPTVEWVKTFGLFGTYGIPVVLASWIYQRIGGEVPISHPTFHQVSRMAICALALIAINNLVMIRVLRVYGYGPSKILRLITVDASIYLLTLPYAICLALSFVTIGWGAVIALAFTGVLANFVARNLAVTRGRSQQQVQRLASLSNIGKTISLRVTTEQLLMAIYTECKKIVDCSLFTIALFDDSRNELAFELDIREGAILPKDRIPMGEGLNSWVVTHHQPLLIGSVDEERKQGLVALPDTKPTESWLGVPMIARDRVVGVISVESYRKRAFNRDDVILLTSIANQAAVALENAHLYKDLEGLTYALEQRVLERTNELRETNLRLMAADRSKNQFLANMSHELRTPLNSIIGFSSVLLESSREALPFRLYRFLENIRTAGNHLLELINDILDLSKIEAGKMELRPERFDLHDTIASVERVMRAFAEDAGIVLTSEIGTDVPEVVLDEGRLKQILFNLLSNAIKFSPRGGPVRISATLVDHQKSPIQTDTLRIDVSDHGMGMAPEEMDKIFDEFYQTEEGRRSSKGGTGLGLSLTRNFIELHHGTIEVQSVPGEGSTFTLFLPVNCQNAATFMPPIRRQKAEG